MKINQEHLTSYFVLRSCFRHNGKIDEIAPLIDVY